MNSVAPEKVAVIGAGAWGTALADLLANSGCEVRLWAREPEVVASFQDCGENFLYLEGIPLNRELAVTNSLDTALSGARVVVWVCPVQYSAALLAEAAPFTPPQAIVVSASKGIEVATLRRMDEIFAGVLPPEQARRLCVLSGRVSPGRWPRGCPRRWWWPAATRRPAVGSRSFSRRIVSGSTRIPMWWAWSWAAP